MALRKSDLYFSLWASRNELRGGMDASQYKDCVLFMLLIKYISDKYGNSGDFAPPGTLIAIPCPAFKAQRSAPRESHPSHVIHLLAMGCAGT
jgi:hypothetical protein